MIDLDHLNNFDRNRYLANKELLNILANLIDHYPT